MSIPLSRRRLFTAALGAAVGASASTFSLRAAANGRPAIGGFDPVAYVALGQPRRGEAAHAAEAAGATWWFASAAHRAAFLADPRRFLPQYGARCAWAMAQGYVAPVDPRQWAIVEGRLFLNFDGAVHRRWLADPPGMIRRADANWPRFQAGTPFA